MNFTKMVCLLLVAAFSGPNKKLHLNILECWKADVVFFNAGLLQRICSAVQFNFEEYDQFVKNKSRTANWVYQLNYFRLVKNLWPPYCIISNFPNVFGTKVHRFMKMIYIFWTVWFWGFGWWGPGTNVIYADFQKAFYKILISVYYFPN